MPYIVIVMKAIHNMNKVHKRGSINDVRGHFVLYLRFD